MTDSKPGYCAQCDAEDADTETDADGLSVCSRCRSTLYDSRQAYIREMKAHLRVRFGMSGDEVEGFLSEHGNPGKGQAHAILNREVA